MTREEEAELAWGLAVISVIIFLFFLSLYAGREAHFIFYFFAAAIAIFLLWVAYKILQLIGLALYGLTVIGVYKLSKGKFCKERVINILDRSLKEAYNPEAERKIREIKLKFRGIDWPL